MATIQDYFRSKYVMGHPDVMQYVDEKTLRVVQARADIARITGADEKKHQEALAIWQTLAADVQLKVRTAFFLWMEDWVPNPATVAVTHPPQHQPLVVDVPEKKTLAIVHTPVDVKDQKQETRMLTTPIFNVGVDPKLINSGPQSKAFYDRKYAQSLDVFRYVWSRSPRVRKISVGQGDDPHTVIYEPYWIFGNNFKKSFISTIIIIKNIFIQSHLPRKYPTFKDWVNLASFIIMQGRPACDAFVSGAGDIDEIIQYEKYCKDWDSFVEQLC